MKFAFRNILLLERDKKSCLPDYPMIHGVPNPWRCCFNHTKSLQKKQEKMDSLFKEHYSKKACMTIVKHDIQFIFYSKQNNSCSRAEKVYLQVKTNDDFYGMTMQNYTFKIMLCANGLAAPPVKLEVCIAAAQCQPFGCKIRSSFCTTPISNHFTQKNTHFSHRSHESITKGFAQLNGKNGGT